jgi:hypothetical protein
MYLTDPVAVIILLVILVHQAARGAMNSLLPVVFKWFPALRDQIGLGGESLVMIWVALQILSYK